MFEEEVVFEEDALTYNKGLQRLAANVDTGGVLSTAQELVDVFLPGDAGGEESLLPWVMHGFLVDDLIIFEQCVLDGKGAVGLALDLKWAIQNDFILDTNFRLGGKHCTKDKSTISLQKLVCHDIQNAL